MTKPINAPPSDRPKHTSHQNWPGSPRQWDWQNHAACNGVDETTQYLFTNPPAPNRGMRAEMSIIAERLNRDYCSQCPVLRQCRNWADNDFNFSGIAGGRVYIDRTGLSRRDRERRKD